jgi:hypothetical protein
MAVATFTLTTNSYPKGNDNTQRRQNVYGGGVGAQAGPNSPPLVVNGVTIVGSSPSYVQGGNRVNFSPLEAVKSSLLLPQWCDVKSLSGSGFVYVFNSLGAAITNLALTSNVVTITAKNNLAAGDVVVLSGLTTTTGLNGVALTVLAGSLTATAFTANFTHANISTAAETGFATPTSYASGVPFQGNLQIFQSAGSAAALAELATGALPAGVTADTFCFRAEFVRV